METRQKIAEWLGNYFTMVVGVFIVLIVALLFAWPFGFLIKQVVNLFKMGYAIW